ncbi:MAG: ABC transporter ATPase [bacterium]
MSVIEFNKLPDSSRLWIYGCARAFTRDEVPELRAQMERFLVQWTAHKRELVVGWEMRYDQFILTAVDESLMAASGCSIDGMVHHLREIENRFQTEIVDTAAKVFYRDRRDAIRCIDRAGFRRLVHAGSAGEETIVFNNVVQTVGELRRGRWEVPMTASWHGQAFATTAGQA